MLDIGWPELLVILVVALIVIGPKDLPRALHTVGKWVRKARMLTREFQGHIDDMVREADLEEVRKQAQQVRQLNLKKELEQTIDPTGALKDAFDPGATAARKQDGARTGAATGAGAVPEAARSGGTGSNAGGDEPAVPVEASRRNGNGGPAAEPPAPKAADAGPDEDGGQAPSRRSTAEPPTAGDGIPAERRA